MNEADFLTRVSRRLGRSVPLTEAPARSVIGAPDFWRQRVLSQSDLLTQFTGSLAELGGHVTVCADKAHLHRELTALLAKLAPGKLGLWGGSELDFYDLSDLLQPYTCLYWGAAATPDLAAFEQVDIGLTGCDFAIADTGSLVLLNHVDRGRGASLLPSIHIALVKGSQLRTRMGEILEYLSQRHAEGATPSFVHVISGPSRSSDIENDQSIGVHGPAAEFVMVLADA